MASRLTGVGIRAVRWDADVRTLRCLLQEYAASLEVDLGFQGFEHELAHLPGEYGPPHGIVFLAHKGRRGLGCVALRPLDWPHVAELKRLYVRPEGRGLGLGAALSEAALGWARSAGYRRVRLDTLPDMAAAQRLYQALGFRPIAPYCFNPVPGTRFMELVLMDTDAGHGGSDPGGC